VTRPRLLTPRWLAAGGVTVLAAALGLALVLQNSGSACAAPPTTSAKKGKATYFSLEGGLGNCSFPDPPALFVALSPSEYSGSAPCGSYLDVTGPKGKVRVKVIDSCPPCTPGHIDLSLAAFRKIGEPVQGIIPITYKTVPNPTVPGPLSVRLKEGSSQYWISVLIDNHANRLTSVKIAGRTAKRESFNYWTVPSGAGRGPFKITVTDVYGRSATLPNIKLAPGQTQRTSTHMGTLATKPKVAAKAESAKAKPASPRAEPSTTAPSPSTKATVAPLLESVLASTPPIPSAQTAVAVSTSCPAA
jgi:expansin (peptidoglycan-binding protein)